jgi:hypothetical protein
VPRRRTLTAALTALLGLAVAAPGAGAAADGDGPGIPGLPPLPTVPGMPIPAAPGDALLPQLVGSPATANPIRHRTVPQLPMLSANGTSSMHDDAYASDAYEVSGPLGRELKVTTASYGVR